VERTPLLVVIEVTAVNRTVPLVASPLGMAAPLLRLDFGFEPLATSAASGSGSPAASVRQPVANPAGTADTPLRSLMTNPGLAASVLDRTQSPGGSEADLDARIAPPAPSTVNAAGFGALAAGLPEAAENSLTPPAGLALATEDGQYAAPLASLPRENDGTPSLAADNEPWVRPYSNLVSRR